MRPIDLRVLTGREVEAFGSAGFQTLGLAAQGRVTLAQLAPGGRIGSHVAPVEQMLVVLAGEADVTGGAEGDTDRAGARAAPAARTESRVCT